MGKKLAAFLSFICIGLGQIYNRQFKKAVILWLTVIFAGLIAIFSYLLFYQLKVHFLFGPFKIIIWLYNIHDAYAYQKRKEERNSISHSEA